MKKNDKVMLSKLREWDAFELRGVINLVTRWCLDDRSWSSALTYYTAEDGTPHLNVRDCEDCEVTYLGKGKLQIVLDEEVKESEDKSDD